MEKGFESEVKKKVMEENEVVDYQVEVTYGGHGSRRLAAEEAMATSLKLDAVEMTQKDKNKPGTNPANWKKTSKVVAALRLTVKLPANSGSKTIRVARLNVGNYSAQPPDTAAPQLVKLTRTAAKTHANKELQTASGIGQARAALVLEEAPTSKQALLNVPGVPKNVLADLYDTIQSAPNIELASHSIKSRYESQ